jgi:predicted DNA-binding transcriptional regulator YafY
MSNKFFRQWTMLQHVPRYPAKTTTRTLKDILAGKGFEVTQRTIQRDLKTLSGIMPGLQVDSEKDFPGWSWSDDSLLLDLPSMDANMALTFQLADHFLATLFPPSILNRLQPYFDTAGNVLQAIDNPAYSHWREKIRILSRTQPLIPAAIDNTVIPVIYEGLFKGRQIRGRYARRDNDEAEYDLHPLGMIFRESVVYLIATVWDYQDPRHFALHRFRKCELLEKEVVVPEEFTVDGYLAAGSFEYGETDGKTIRLKVRFFNSAGHHLFETPLSNDQILVEGSEGELEVEATVKDSAQIRWWLLGFGDGVEVLEPLSLRKEFVEVCQRMVGRYR